MIINIGSVFPFQFLCCRYLFLVALFVLLILTNNMIFTVFEIYLKMSHFSTLYIWKTNETLLGWLSNIVNVILLQLLKRLQQSQIIHCYANLVFDALQIQWFALDVVLLWITLSPTFSSRCQWKVKCSFENHEMPDMLCFFAIAHRFLQPQWLRK